MPRPLFAPVWKIAVRPLPVPCRPDRRAASALCWFLLFLSSPLQGSAVRVGFAYPDAFGHCLVHERQAERIIGGVQGLVELGEEIQDVQYANHSAPRHSGVALFQPVERL